MSKQLCFKAGRQAGQCCPGKTRLSVREDGEMSIAWGMPGAGRDGINCSTILECTWRKFRVFENKKQPVMMLMVIDCGDATSFCREI